jgi:hypothetical protein
MPPLVDRPALPPPALFLLPPSNDDDDDGLPPLVDRPLSYDAPPAPVTFTFCTNDFAPSRASEAPATRSHARKRGADYIPRPPNAFILFRASFVKAQAVPTKVVNGSHASLSKVVGHVWKAMDKEQRAHWEQAAVAALATHKERYPDWRFRPAANGNAGGSVGRMKDGAGKKRKGKQGDGGDADGRGGGGKRRRGKDKDECERIANFVKEGLTGEVLVSAVQAWDAAVGLGVEKSARDAVHINPVIVAPVAQHPHTSLSSNCTPFTAMYRHAPFTERSRSPPPCIPSSPPPVVPTSPVSYVPAQETFDASMLFGDYGASAFADFGARDSYRNAFDISCAGSGYAPASPVASGFSPASPAGSSFYSPVSPASSFSYSPTSAWSERRSSFSSLCADAPEDPFAGHAHAPFNPNVAIYDPADAPAPVDPYAFGAYSDLNGGAFAFGELGNVEYRLGGGEKFCKFDDVYAPAWSHASAAVRIIPFAHALAWLTTVHSTRPSIHRSVTGTPRLRVPSPERVTAWTWPHIRSNTGASLPASILRSPFLALPIPITAWTRIANTRIPRQLETQKRIPALDRLRSSVACISVFLKPRIWNKHRTRREVARLYGYVCYDRNPACSFPRIDSPSSFSTSVVCVCVTGSLLSVRRTALRRSVCR